MSYLNMERGTKKPRHLSWSSPRPQSKVHKVARDPSSARSKYRDSSARLPLVKSHNLTSLINQFEKLDAVTVSIAVPSFQSTSRQPSQELSKKQSNKKAIRLNPDLETSIKMKGSCEKAQEVSRSNDEYMPRPKPLKMQSRILSDLEKELSPYQSSVKVKGVYTNGIVKKNYQGCLKGLNCTSTTSTQNMINSSKRTISMQEKIRFFDSSISAIENSKSRLCIVAPTNSISRSERKVREEGDKIDLSTRREGASNQTFSLNLPKIASDEGPSNRKLILGSKISNSSLTKKGSPYSFNRNVSPKTLRAFDWGRVNIKSGDSGKNKNSHFSLVDFDSRLITKGLRQDVGEDQKIQKESLNVKQNSKGSSRRPYDKIETLFHRSSDQVHDTSRKNQSRILGSFPSSMVQLKNPKTVNQSNKLFMPRELNAKKYANFANIRKKFETELSPDGSTGKFDDISIKQDNLDTLLSNQDKKLSLEFIDGLPTSQSTGLSPKWCQFTNKELVSPEIAQKYVSVVAPLITRTKNSQISQVKAQRIGATSSSTFLGETVTPSTTSSSQGLTFFLLKNKTSKASSGLVGDKVKQFESIKSVPKLGAFKKGTSITRRLNRSFKGSFENRVCNKNSREKIGSLSTSDFGDHWDEFRHVETQNIEPESTMKSRETLSSKNLSIRSNNEGSSGKKIRSSSLDEMDVWVIKKVNCGLRQPKPMRAVEVKRMMLLCRGAVGSSSKMNIPNR